jgi:hypothetical protein
MWISGNQNMIIVQFGWNMHVKIVFWKKYKEITINTEECVGSLYGELGDIPIR